MSSLLQRLKERKLFQWTLAYLAGAWLVLEGIDFLSEPWGLSPFVVRAMQLLVGIGFLVTLVLAWYHGEKGRQHVSGPELLLIAGVLAIAGLLLAVLRPAETAGPLGSDATRMRPTSSTDRSVVRVAVALPPHQPLAGAARLAPDGTAFLYVGQGGRGSLLYLRPLDQLEARPIPGTEAASDPFFSPDGQWVGFFSEDKLRIVALAGGPPVTVAQIPRFVLGASWGPNDTIVFAPTTGSGLSRISAAGGEPEVITTPDLQRGEVSHRWPAFMPNGAVLFTAWNGKPEDAHVGVVSLETGELKYLLPGTDARYSTTGHLVYASADGSLLIAPFDPDRLEVTGPAVPIIEGVSVSWRGSASFTLSRDGTLIYLSRSVARRSVVFVDRDGVERPLTDERRGFMDPRFAPGGDRLAVSIYDGITRDVWVYGLEDGILSRLTFTGENRYPAWTSDGRRVAFSSYREGAAALFWAPADGSGAAERLLTAQHDQYPGSWTLDGRSLIYHEMNPTSGRDIWVLPLDEDRTPWPYLQESHEELSPRLSPDGRWLAYVSNESGRHEVYVRAFPAPGSRWQVSTGGGTEPLWAPGGRELFYRSDNELMAAAIETEPTFRLLTREALFEDPYVRRFFYTNYDIHSDGERFVMIKSGEESAQLIVVLNWFEELRRRNLAMPD
jgi:serine/threonine-protein kinase